MARFPWISALALALLGGCTMPSLSVRDIDGTTCTPLGHSATDVVVLVFSSPDCPIANAIAPELDRLYQRTVDGGGEFYLVHVRDDVTPKRAAEHATAYALHMPILLDTAQALVRHADATVTPEAVVYRRTADDWRVVYQGGVNNLYASLGNRRDKATEHWLRDSIDVALADGDVTPAYRRPLGCFIERRP